MEAVRTSKTSVYFKETTQRYSQSAAIFILSPWEPEISHSEKQHER
jgi:hypothetical protein